MNSLQPNVYNYNLLQEMQFTFWIKGFIVSFGALVTGKKQDTPLSF